MGLERSALPQCISTSAIKFPYYVKLFSFSFFCPLEQKQIYEPMNYKILLPRNSNVTVNIKCAESEYEMFSPWAWLISIDVREWMYTFWTSGANFISMRMEQSAL